MRGIIGLCVERPDAEITMEPASGGSQFHDAVAVRSWRTRSVPGGEVDTAVPVACQSATALPDSSAFAVRAAIRRGAEGAFPGQCPRVELDHPSVILNRLLTPP